MLLPHPPNVIMEGMSVINDEWMSAGYIHTVSQWT